MYARLVKLYIIRSQLVHGSKEPSADKAQELRDEAVDVALRAFRTGSYRCGRGQWGFVAIQRVNRKRSTGIAKTADITHVKLRGARSGATSFGSGGSGFVMTPTILVTGGRRIPSTGHRFGGLRVPERCRS